MDPVRASDLTPDDANAPSTTTSEQDRTTLGQRRVNLIWEVTQATIAVLVTLASVWVSGVLCLRGKEGDTAAFLLLSNSFFLIVGFYFSRTNHTKVGGVGFKSGEGR